MNQPGTQAIDRAAHLLTLVVQADGPITFTELVDEAGLARSTTSRLLSALEANQLVERNAHGSYRSGALFAFHAARHDPWSQAAQLAEPLLRDIGEQTRETVNLAIPRGDAVVQIAQIDSSYMLGARDWRTVDVPPHTSALGKVLYAFAALEVPDGPLERPTPHSVRSVAALRRQLPGVRRSGYAITRGELEVGLDAVAAPVRGADGTVIAALGVSGPSTRLEPEIDHIGQLLIKQADALSRLLQPRPRTKGVA